jgi:MFS transporter, ACS family, tartrate transporter
MAGSVPVAALSRRHPVRTRVARRWLPFLFVLYVANFVDRANLAYAGLGMSRDLGFSERMFGTAAGIFFVGYLSLQIPGALMAERWGARRLIGAIIIVWGGLTVLTGFVQTPLHLYAARFLLGAAEAAFFPAVLIYLSHWFVYEDRAKAIANFMAAIPVSFIMGAPVAGLLLGVHWFGVAGWRWLFFLEGIPAVLLGLSAIFYLSDEPSSTVWLSEDERSWLARTLADEKGIKTANKSCSAWDAVRYRPAILLAGVALFAFSAGYSFYFWLPTMLKRFSGLSDLHVSLLGAVPFVAGLLAMQLNGWLSDLRCEQRWHISVPLIAEALAFLCLVVLPPNPWVTVALFTVVGAGTCALLPCLWNFPTLLLSDSAAAAAIGLMNTFGSLGGVVGPYAIGYLYSRTHSFSSGLSCLMVSCLMAASLVLFCPVSRFKAARTPSVR